MGQDLPLVHLEENRTLLPILISLSDPQRHKLRNECLAFEILFRLYDAVIHRFGRNKFYDQNASREDAVVNFYFSENIFLFEGQDYLRTIHGRIFLIKDNKQQIFSIQKICVGKEAKKLSSLKIIERILIHR